MTKSYVVRGQGVQFLDGRYRLPAHVEIHFYRPRQRAPQIRKPRTILDATMVELGVFPDWFAEPGQLVPGYHCWASPDERQPSGVFRRSSGDLVIDLAGTGPARPVELGHIVEQLARGRERRLTVLHWLVTTTATGTRELPAHHLQRPPRRERAQVAQLSNRE